MSDTTTKQTSLADAWQLCLIMLLGAAVIMLPDFAFATTYNNGIEETLCKAKDLFTGTTGKALATIAVTIIGIGALLGKVSWGMAMIVGIGIALVFGASTLVDVVKPGAAISGC